MYVCRERPHWGVTQTFVELGERHDLVQVKTALHDIFLLSMCDRGTVCASLIIMYMRMYCKRLVILCMYVCICMYVCMYVCMWILRFQ